MKQNEKQLEVKRLYSQVIRPQVSKVKICFTVKNIYGELKEMEEVFYLFILNNEKYIGKNSLISEVHNFINQKKDEIKTTDSIHAHVKTEVGDKIVVFIKTGVLLAYKEELENYAKKGAFGSSNMERIGRMYKAINSPEPVSENYIDQESLKASEEAFARRVELIKEGSRATRAENCRKRQEEEHRVQQNTEDTLKDLVAKIEAMGWDVTLKLKES